MRPYLRLRALIVAVLVMCPAGLAAARDEAVDVELVLAVDVSLSMLPFELEIQRKGYAAAITSTPVLNAIAEGVHGKIAVTYFEWAGQGRTNTVIDWMVIAGPQDARRFAAILTGTPTQGLRRTSIAGAIDHAAGLFDDNGFTSFKRVIDISGDGPNNQGRAVTQARDDAVARGLTINGLPLMTLDSSPYGSFDIPDIDKYYANCVIGGPGAFMVPVDAWDQFPEAIRRKLVLELAQFDPETGDQPVVRVAASPSYDCLIGEKMWNRRFNSGEDN